MSRSRSPGVAAAAPSTTLLGFVLFLSLLLPALAQNVSTTVESFGQPCDPALKGYTAALKYFDECNSDMLACNPQTNTCAWKTCANVDFIKNWDVTKNSKVPQRCPSNQYCPDSGLACMNLLPLGSSCEPQRDDECSPAPLGICMNFTCYSKSAGLNAPCGVDYQQFNYAYNGLITVTQNIYRDNCTVGLTCDTSTGLCKLGGVIGTTCNQDRDCASQSCSSGPNNPIGVCTKPPDTYNALALWQWIAIGSGVFAFVLFTLAVLFLLHRLQRRWEQKRIAEFFGAQDDIKREIGFSDADDARSSIVLTTPLPDFKRRSNASSDLQFLRSPSANASRVSFQSDAGVPGRSSTPVYDPLTGSTHAEEVKRQYEHNRQSWNPQAQPSTISPGQPSTTTSTSMPSNGNRRSHPLMHGTSAPERRE